MFEEIPPPAGPPSQEGVITAFGILFAFFLSLAAFVWFYWSRPLSLSHKISAVNIIFGCVGFGVFLLTAKSVTPESNRKRMTALLLVVVVLGLISDLVQ